MQTYLIYTLTLIIALLASRSAQKHNRRGRLIFAAIVLSLVAGLRAETVGIDSSNYAALFGHIADGHPELAYGLEESFKFICSILLFINNSSNFLFFVFALITNVLIFARLWDFKDNISLPWAIGIYFGVFYFMTFNIMRQFVAAAIIFFATRYLAEKKYFKFLIFVVIATLFHKSALLGLAFVVLDVFAWVHLTVKQKRIIKILLTVGPIVLVLFGAAVIGKYSGYFESISFNFGIMLFLKLLLFIATALFVRPDLSGNEDQASQETMSYALKTARVYYLVGILITMIGYVFPFMERIGIYFYLFETVYIGTLMRSKQVNFILKAVMILLFGFFCVTAIIGNGQGQENYLFFWQQQLT